MQRWTVSLEGGPRRVNHAAVAIGDKIFSFGGYCTGEDYEVARPIDVHMLNTVSYRWSTLPAPAVDENMPYQRYGHTAVCYNEKAYVWGGRNDGKGACNVLFCFDPVTRTWTRPDVEGQIPGARDGHSACIIHNAMYVFGGYEEKVDKFSNEIHSLDLITMTWSLLKVRGKPARWRDFHSATGHGDNMYIFGGRSDRAGPFHTSNEVYCPHIQVYNTVSHLWTEPAASGIVPCGRRSHSAFIYNDELYVFGGYNGRFEVHFGELYKFNLESQVWSLVLVKGQGPCARRRQCCSLVGNRIFLFGGTSPTPEPCSDGTEWGLVDLSDLHVLDFEPTLKTLCMISVIDNDLDPVGLPRDLRWELAAMTTNSNISRPLNTSG